MKLISSIIGSDRWLHLAIDCWKQNLCVTAAYRPVRDLIQQERLKNLVNSHCMLIICLSGHALFCLLFLQWPWQCLLKYLLKICPQERKRRAEEGESSEEAPSTKEEKEENKDEEVIALRPLSMEDLRQAKNQVIESPFPHLLCSC